MLETTATQPMAHQETISFHRYPARSLLGDYLRSLGGLFFSLAVLLTSEPHGVVLVIFGGTALLLAVFALRTLRQHMIQVAVSEQGVFTRLLRTRAIPWEELRHVKLRYFGTRRQRRQGGPNGFLQLTLRGAGSRMTFESNLDGFDDLLKYAAEAAHRNRLSLDPATAGNFLGMGVDPDETPRRLGQGE